MKRTGCGACRGSRERSMCMACMRADLKAARARSKDLRGALMSVQRVLSGPIDSGGRAYACIVIQEALGSKP